MGLIIKDKVQYGSKSGTVRFDQAQSLTAAQQAQARGNIGLGNVDNTSDTDKPVSTAQQAALDDKADASDIATIEQKLDSASAYGEVGPVPVADISDALPLDAAKLVIDIEPVQSGSGDPSPTNVRPISGWTGAAVTVNEDVLNITFPASAGTVYGGTLDVTTGLLTVDRASVDLSTLRWVQDSTYEFWRTDDLNMVIKKSSSTNAVTGSICEEYNAYGYNRLQVNKTIIGFAVATTGRVAVRNGSTTVEPTNNICYELVTPITYQLTPQQVTMLQGANNVWADCGDTTVGFWRDDSLSINKAITERAQVNSLTFDTQPTEGSTNPVTSGGVYDEFEQTVRVTAQTLTEQQKYTARQNIGAVGAADIGALRFGVSGVGLSSPTLTRLYDAAGMTATPSTDTVEGHSDFDAYAPFNRRKCVGSWSVVSGESKATFTVNAYEGDADYAEDGSMGDYVAVEVDPFYYYDADGILAVSTYPYPGYKIHPVCLDYDGNIRAHTYLPCYALALDGNGKAVSLPGYTNQYGGYKDLRDYAKTYNDADAKAYAIIEPTKVWHYEWLLQTIEFATTNMQSVMEGAADMRYNTNDEITYVPGANQVVMGATGSNFVIGQSVLIYSAHDISVSVDLQNRITNIQKCDADGTVNASGSYYLITYDGMDRSSSIVVNSWKIASRPWITGACFGAASGVNTILGHTGSPISLSNGKYPMAYRWRENVYGNQFMTSLDLADVRVSEGNNIYHLDWFYLADPRKYSPYGNFGTSELNDSSKGWVKLGITTPAANYVNNYVKTLSANPDYPWLKVPTETQSSSTLYYCDYTNIVSSAEVRALRRGGSVYFGAYVGPCHFHTSNAPSFSAWYFGSALYFLQ